MPDILPGTKPDTVVSEENGYWAALPVELAAGAGLTAYQVAVAAGFTGTQAEWLASLVGPRGDEGLQGVEGNPGGPGPQGNPGTTLHSGLTDTGPDQHHAQNHVSRHETGGADELVTLPSPGQKNALAGTTGTPGMANRYATDLDPRLSDARNPIGHAHADGDIPGTITRDSELVASMAAHASLQAHAGTVPVYISATEPLVSGPALWVDPTTSFLYWTEG